jgi:hypothetical protein
VAGWLGNGLTLGQTGVIASGVPSQSGRSNARPVAPIKLTMNEASHRQGVGLFVCRR